jgi:hypothetical protein
MTMSIEELYDRALALSSDVEDKFLELGRSLRQLQDRDPDLFQQVVKKRLGRRKAYYLVEVSRKFEPLPISRARLKKIGWTKLQIIGRHVTKDNVEELVGLAEQLKTKQLERKMGGRSPLMCRLAIRIACSCTLARNSMPNSKKSFLRTGPRHLGTASSAKKRP